MKSLSAKDNLAFIRSMLGVDSARKSFDAKNDPKEAKYLAAYSGCKSENDVVAAKDALLKSNPSEKAAIEKFAELRLRELSIEGADRLGIRSDRKISEQSSGALMMMK